MWWYWVIGIIVLLIIIEELIYYLERRIAFGKREIRIIAWIKNLIKKKEEIPAGDEPQRRRR